MNVTVEKDLSHPVNHLAEARGLNPSYSLAPQTNNPHRIGNVILKMCLKVRRGAGSHGISPRNGGIKFSIVTRLSSTHVQWHTSLDFTSQHFCRSIPPPKCWFSTLFPPCQFCSHACAIKCTACVSEGFVPGVDDIKANKTQRSRKSPQRHCATQITIRIRVGGGVPPQTTSPSSCTHNHHHHNYNRRRLRPRRFGFSIVLKCHSLTTTCQSTAERRMSQGATSHHPHNSCLSFEVIDSLVQ